jgi:hypothetical protein
MKRPNRFGVGQAGRGFSISKNRGSRLTEEQREICARCRQVRWLHEREGLVMDHEFVQKPSEERQS